MAYSGKQTEWYQNNYPYMHAGIKFGGWEINVSYTNWYGVVK